MNIKLAIGFMVVLGSVLWNAEAAKASDEDALSARQKSIVTIASFTANGEMSSLKMALNDGLDAGLTINEAKEVLIHLYAYCGFPRSLNGLSTLQDVLEQRRQNGIKDEWGKEASPLPAGKTSHQLGSEVLVQLVGTSEASGVRQFAPAIDTLLKEHLFGDLFGRDVLDFQSREIATISALASMPGTEDQLGSHLRVGRNVGLTDAQLKAIAFEIAVKVGWQEGQRIDERLDNMIENKTSERKITKNGVSVQKVVFPNLEITMVGNMYSPANFDEAKQYPAIVVGHPNGGVKEQTSGLYAEKLAQKGYITLAFDASYQGESGGEPRFLDDPAARTEDYSAAADFITTRSFVNPERVGVLGICAGGGYAIHSAQTEHRFKAVATVSMVDGGDLRRNGLNGSLTPTIQKRLDEVAQQRIVEAKGGPIRYNNFVANAKEEIPANAGALYTEGYEYYRVTHKEPTAPNKYTFTSLDKLINFTALDHVELISPRPLLIIAGSEAESFYFSQRAYDKAAEPKELFTVPGATHIKLYYKPEYVEPAVNKLSEFYRKNLPANESD